MTTTQPTLAPEWGPLATPIHLDVDPIVDEDGLSWWDYALFCWWDPDAGVYVMTHHMTTPDDRPGRTRVSATVGDRSVEVIEHTKPDSHDGDTVTVDLTGSIKVDHPDLKLDVEFTPLFQPIDFHTAGAMPTLKKGGSLNHYQHPQRAKGTITLKGDTRDFSGTGLRDRTWGYRSETAQWGEYQYIMAEIDDSFVAVHKVRGTAENSQRDMGFLLTEDGQQEIGFSFAFNGSGLFNDVTLELPDGPLNLEIVSRPAGFWVPMGWRQTGKVFSAFDDFVLMRTPEGKDIAGLATYGILRQLD